MTEHGPIKEAVVAALESEHGPGVVNEHEAGQAENEETDDLEELESQEETEGEGQEEASEGDDGSEDTDSPDEPEPLSPPEHWSQDDQTVFQELPREAQEYVLRREKDFESDYTQKAQAIAPVQSILDQNKAYFESLGASPDSVLNYFFNADRVLRTGMPEEKKQALLQVAQQYGIDLQPPQTAPSDNQAGQFYDEMGNAVDVGALVQNALQPIQQQLGQVTQAVTGFMTQEQQAKVNQAAAKIEAFRSEKDESGNLRHPHFDRLRPQIEQLAAFQQAQGQTPDLAALYTNACALDPIAIEQMKQEQTVSLSSKKKEKVAKAKVAAKAQVTGSRTSLPAEQKSFKTAQEAAQDAFNRLAGEG